MSHFLSNDPIALEDLWVPGADVRGQVNYKQLDVPRDKADDVYRDGDGDLLPHSPSSTSRSEISRL